MGLTLNQTLKRIKLIAESHNQIRSYRLGLAGDMFADHTAKYPACCLQYVNGNVSTAGHVATINFRMFVVDLVHVSQDTKENEDEVLSDTLSIILDLVAQMNHGDYADWRLSTDNTAQVLIEAENDMHAGWYIDFSIRIMFSQDVCVVPSDLIFSEIINENTKVYDEVYEATGSEGTTLSIPAIVGKKVLLVAKDTFVLQKVSNLPNSVQYVWNNVAIVLGMAPEPLERFLILYRNY